MAAFLHPAAYDGAFTATATVARLRDVVQATLDQQGRGRPTLLCRWLQDADGRLSCYWDIEVPTDRIESEVTDQ